MTARPAKVCSHGVSLNGLFTCTNAYIVEIFEYSAKSREIFFAGVNFFAQKPIKSTNQTILSIFG